MNATAQPQTLWPCEMIEGNSSQKKKKTCAKLTETDWFLKSVWFWTWKIRLTFEKWTTLFKMTRWTEVHSQQKKMSKTDLETRRNIEGQNWSLSIEHRAGSQEKTADRPKLNERQEHIHFLSQKKWWDGDGLGVAFGKPSILNSTNKVQVKDDFSPTC